MATSMAASRQKRPPQPSANPESATFTALRGGRRPHALSSFVVGPRCQVSRVADSSRLLCLYRTGEAL